MTILILDLNVIWFDWIEDLGLVESGKVVIIKEDDEKARIVDLVSNMNAELVEKAKKESADHTQAPFIFRKIEKNNKTLNVYECSEVC